MYQCPSCPNPSLVQLELCDYCPSSGPPDRLQLGWPTLHPYHKRKEMQFLKSEVDNWLKSDKRKSSPKFRPCRTVYLAKKGGRNEQPKRIGKFSQMAMNPTDELGAFSKMPSVQVNSFAKSIIINELTDDEICQIRTPCLRRWIDAKTDALPAYQSRTLQTCTNGTLPFPNRQQRSLPVTRRERILRTITPCIKSIMAPLNKESIWTNALWPQYHAASCARTIQ